MKHNYNIVYDNIILRQICEDDLEKLRIWRNDKAKTTFLTPIDFITREKQIEWYNNYLNDDSIISFSIFENSLLKKMIGSVALYDFNNKEAEIGKIQIGEDAAHGKGYGRISLLMVCKLGFDVLNLDLIKAHVHTDNVPSYKNFFKLGFKITGTVQSVVGGEEYELLIDKKTIFEKNHEYNEIKIIYN